MTAEAHQEVVAFPGGIRVRFRWAGSGQGAAVHALSEAGGVLHDYGARISPTSERLCRAELRVESPGGTWAARLASPIFDAPTGLAWDTAGLLVVAYGFATYGLEARTGELRWLHRSGGVWRTRMSWPGPRSWPAASSSRATAARSARWTPRTGAPSRRCGHAIGRPAAALQRWTACGQRAPDPAIRWIAAIDPVPRSR